MSSSVRSPVNHHRHWKKKSGKEVSDKGWNERAVQGGDEWQRAGDKKISDIEGERKAQRR